jgi:hypothetical protein
MEKCLYYNDHQTAATLMIDDPSFVSIMQNGKIVPQSDWGGGLTASGSIYRYVADTLLTWFPEIRGTFFFPIADHGLMNPNSNYELYYNRDATAQRNFFEISGQFFEVAYHGTDHGRYRDQSNCALFDNWDQEFSYVTLDDVPRIRSMIDKIEELYDIHMTGGKYPGYAKNKCAHTVVESLGFRWWAADSDMIDRKCEKNRHVYYEGDKVVLIPTNVSGSIFFRNSTSLARDNWKAKVKKKMPLIRSLWCLYQDLRAEAYISYLYEKRLIISVQEHFVNLRTDGKRQTPNIYDDVFSVARIYALLRGMDVWHTTCGELAHYIESYDHSRLARREDGLWDLSYHGSWDDMFLTICSTHAHLRNHSNDKVIHGVYRMGKWVFNHVEPGLYEEL